MTRKVCLYYYSAFSSRSVTCVYPLSDLEHDSECDSRSDDTVGPIASRIHPAPLQFRRERTQNIIETWRTDPLGYNMQPPENWRELSPALSDFSDSSASSTTSTVRGFGDQQLFEGGWLTGNPGEAFPPHLYVHWLLIPQHLILICIIRDSVPVLYIHTGSCEKTLHSDLRKIQRTSRLFRRGVASMRWIGCLIWWIRWRKCGVLDIVRHMELVKRSV
jgi:hypothetical protein